MIHLTKAIIREDARFAEGDRATAKLTKHKPIFFFLLSTYLRLLHFILSYCYVMAISVKSHHAWPVGEYSLNTNIFIQHIKDFDHI